MPRLLTLEEAIDQLGHAQAGHRRSAAKRLGQIGDPRACEPLCSLCIEHELHRVTFGAFRAMARLGLSAADDDVAAFHAVALDQQVQFDLKGTNPHLDLRYPLIQAARNWQGPARTELLRQAATSGGEEMATLARAANEGRLLDGIEP